MRSKNPQYLQLIKMNQQIDEVAPPGWGHTKPDKKKGMKVGGTAAAMKKAKAQGKMPGVKNIFALMWSMKNKGDKAHYKPSKKGVLKKKYKKKKKNEERELIFQANRQMAYVIAEGILSRTLKVGLGSIPLVGGLLSQGLDKFQDDEDAEEAKEKADKEKKEEVEQARKQERIKAKELRAKQREEAARERQANKERDQELKAREAARLRRVQGVETARKPVVPKPSQQSLDATQMMPLAAHTEFQYKNAYVQKLMETKR